MKTDHTEQATMGKVLRDYRRRAGMTQEEIGDLLGTARTTIIGIEQGTRRIRADELALLARQYGVMEEDFFRACDLDKEEWYQKKALLALPPPQKKVMARILARGVTAKTWHFLELLAIPHEALEEVAAAIIELLSTEEEIAEGMKEEEEEEDER